MPEISKKLYEGNGIGEVLPDDGWQHLVDQAELTLLSPKQWYWRDGINGNYVSKESAIAQADSLLKIAQLASSDPDGVRDALIARKVANK